MLRVEKSARRQRNEIQYQLNGRKATPGGQKWKQETTDMDLMQGFILFFVSLIHPSVQSTDQPYVTCGSVVKLVNVNYRVRLHSHDIKYGSGSGQQSVTGVDESEDANSYWQVKGPMESGGQRSTSGSSTGTEGPTCVRGTPVKCGSSVRFQHLNTGKNLHSHLFSSPLSGNQEISAFGDLGTGDTGDNWIVVCSGDFWEREETIRLKHVDTEK